MTQFRDLNESHQAPDGELYIALASHPTLVWDMPRASTAPGTAPIIYTRNNGAHQRWRFEVDHHGTKYTFFYIVNVHSGLALTVQPDRTITQQPKAAYDQGGRRQQWIMGYPGFAGSTSDPARPSQPHPTGSSGTRLRVLEHNPVDATPATSGTLIAFSRWDAFETGWTFTAAP